MLLFLQDMNARLELPRKVDGHYTFYGPQNYIRFFCFVCFLIFEVACLSVCANKGIVCGISFFKHVVKDICLYGDLHCAVVEGKVTAWQSNASSFSLGLHYSLKLIDDFNLCYLSRNFSLHFLL